MKPGLFLVSLCFLIITLGCQKNDSTPKEIIPFAPTELTGKLLSATQVQLNWTDKSTNEKGFRIEKKTGNALFTLIDSVGVDVTTYTDKGLTPGLAYTYRVTAFNGAGLSITYSNEVVLIPIGLPVLSTLAVADTTAINASSGGLISTDGGSAILARGIVWSTSANPDLTLTSKTVDGNGIGTFASKLTGLKANTKYYIRAYATNLAGTSYGQELSFITPVWDIETGLVAYYPFNGNANDESSSGNNGIVNGALLTADRQGIQGKAYSFNGVDAFIKIPVTPSLIIQNTISISAWVYRLNGNNNLPEGIVGPATYLPTTPGYFFRVVDNLADLGISSPYTEGFSKNTVKGGTWVHLVGVYNNNSIRIYMNGVLEQETAVGAGKLGSWTSPNFLTIGQERDYASPSFVHPWNGYLDEIRIYNRELGQQEINFIYIH